MLGRLFAQVAAAWLVVATAYGQAQLVPADSSARRLPEGARLRLGTLQFRAPFTISDAALSPDGKLLAVSGEVNGLQGSAGGPQVCVFDTATGDRLTDRLGQISRGFSYPYKTNVHRSGRLRFSQDGKRLFNFCWAEQINWYDVAMDGRKPQTFEMEREPGTAACFPDGSWFDAHFVAYELTEQGKRKTECVRIAHVQTGDEICRVEPELKSNAAELSFDGTLLATWGDDGGNSVEELSLPVQIWDANCGKLKRRIVARGYPRGFSPDGSILVTVENRGVQLWNVSTGKLLMEMTVNSKSVQNVAFSSDGKTIAICGFDKFVQTWDLKSGARTNFRTGALADGLQFTPDGRLLAWAIRGPAVHLWEPAKDRPAPISLEHSQPPGSIVFTNDGKQIVSASPDGHVIAWDAATGRGLKELLSARPATDVGHQVGFGQDDGLRPATLSSDGRHLRYEHVVDLSTGDNVLDLGESGGDVTFLSESGRATAIGWQGRDFTICDLRTSRNIARVPLPHNCLSSAISLDVKRLALVVADNSELPQQKQQVKNLIVWDLIAGTSAPPAPIDLNSIGRMVFLDDRQILMFPVEHEDAVICDAISGRVLFCLDRKLGIHESQTWAISPDNRLLAFATIACRDSFVDGELAFERDDGRRHICIRILEIASGTVRHEFVIEEAYIKSLAFSPDGKTLASGMSDSTILLWDLFGHPQEITSLTANESLNLWQALLDEEAQVAGLALRAFAARPQEAVSLLKRELRPIEAATASPEEMANLINDSGADRFRTRDRAEKKLLQLGSLSLPAVNQALTANPTIDKRQRLERICTELNRPESPRRWLRELRAVELLERIASPQARRLLQAMATGNRDALPT